MPLLFIAFNRPHLLQQQLDNLATLFKEPPPLYIAIDGPRANHPTDAERVNACRQIATTHPVAKGAHTLFQDRNLGCKVGVPTAIDWFFSQVEEGIILEDDCVPCADFFRYVTECLERYRHDERIGIISGHSRYNFQTTPTDAYAFTESGIIWGWATWRRVWQHYDYTLARYRPQAEALLQAQQATRCGRYLGQMLRAVLEERLDTWDIQLQAILAIRHYINLRPAVNLIINTGANSSDATHTAAYDFEQPHFSSYGKLTFPLQHPTRIERDLRADRLYDLRTSGWVTRGMCFLGAHLYPNRFTRPLLMLATHILWRLEPYCPILFRL